MNNEALGSRADIVKRVASDQGQFRLRSPAQHFNIARTDDFSPFHAIPQQRSRNRQRDDIIPTDVT